MKILDVFEQNDLRKPFVEHPCVIAEAGVNHEGDLDLAYRLVDEAKEGGADVIKFQTYKAEKLAAVDSPAYWDLESEPTASQRKLFEKYDGFGPKEYEKIKLRCDKREIDFMSTAFDMESANFINDLVDVHKIASADITCKPLVEHIASFSKPILLSTGAATLAEICAAFEWMGYGAYGAGDIILSHCVLNYPTLDKDANLGRILTLKGQFPAVYMGYSDHTLPYGMETLITAALLGAVVLEKHFTFDKTLPGNDHYHAMDMNDLALFRARWKDVYQSLGSGRIDPAENEALAREHARRSLVTTKDLPKGHFISEGDLTWKRPAHGIAPYWLDHVLGDSLSGSLAGDTILQWKDLNRE